MADGLDKTRLDFSSRISMGRSRGHSTFITELLIRNPERQARFFAATITQVSVSAHQE
jgi:hypothetical protein